MPKNKHHYVPKFYLRRFASDIKEEEPRQIHIVHIASKRIILNAGLRDQCYGRKFYGKTDELEDAFGDLEGETASLFREIDSRSSLSFLSKEDKESILFFIALQSVRTVAAVSNLQEGSDLLKKGLVDNSPGGIAPELLNSFEFTNEQAIAVMVEGAITLAELMDDLAFRLVINKSPGNFITSDNPCIKYNQYCQSNQSEGITAPSRTGFQLFLPISARLLLMLYDKDVYKAARLVNDVFFAHSQDVMQINLLQTVFADKVLLFSRAEEGSYLVSVVDSAINFREQYVPRVEWYVADEDQNEMFHTYQQTPNLELRLTFLDLRRKCVGKSIGERSTYRESSWRFLDPDNQRLLPRKKVRTFRKKK